MKIKIAKADLAPALQLASIAITNDENITGHFLFRQTEEGNVQLLASNGRIGVQIPLKCNAEESEAKWFTIPAKRLKDWGAVIEADDVISLETTKAKGKVVASSKRRPWKASFRSMDPESFPFWDGVYEEAKKVSSIKASRFKSALSIVKDFIYPNETQAPTFSLCTARDGSLIASDKSSLAACKVAELKKCAFRIHSAEVPAVLSFLQYRKDSTDEESESDGVVVSLVEHERAFFIVYEDGTLLNVGRPNIAFPKLRYDSTPGDPFTWTLDCSEILMGIQQMTATADKDEKDLRFRFDGENIRMSMISAEGSSYEIPVKCQEVGEDKEIMTRRITEMVRGMNQDKFNEMKEDEFNEFMSREVPKFAERALEKFTKNGFVVNYKHMKRLVTVYGEEKIQLGVSPMGKGGFVRLLDEHENGDSDMIMVAWLQDHSTEK